MADLSITTALVSTLGAIEGRAGERFAGLRLVAAIGRLQADLRHIRPTTASITDQVVLKVNSNTEVPFVNGRVWLLRLADGFKAWEGWSDAQGYYTATGLEVGVEYVAVAIDPTRQHKTTGAGPVTAL